MKDIWIFCATLTVWISIIKVNSIEDVMFFQGTYSELSSSGEFISIQSECDDETVKRWQYDFHECFMDRKYKDGGQELESIVDRILGHVEACVEISSKDCRPNFEGFETILAKVIEQIKDYSSMYLNDIYSGRDKIKDLKCVEETLSLEVYHACFTDLPEALNKTDYEFQNAVKDGIRCTNSENLDCSPEARTSLNRVVRTIFSLEQPPEEDLEERPTVPPPKVWYQYITDPIVSAWNSVKQFFSDIFG